jgi:hypothetical protein
MPEGDLVEWFNSLPPLTQIFFGMFVLLTAIPIATLIVFQLLDSVRSLWSPGAGSSDAKHTKARKK